MEVSSEELPLALQLLSKAASRVYDAQQTVPYVRVHLKVRRMKYIRHWRLSLITCIYLATYQIIVAHVHFKFTSCDQ